MSFKKRKVIQKPRGINQYLLLCSVIAIIILGIFLFLSKPAAIVGHAYSSASCDLTCKRASMTADCKQDTLSTSDCNCLQSPTPKGTNCAAGYTCNLNAPPGTAPCTPAREGPTPQYWLPAINYNEFPNSVSGWEEVVRFCDQAPLTDYMVNLYDESWDWSEDYNGGLCARVSYRQYNHYPYESLGTLDGTVLTYYSSYHYGNPILNKKVSFMKPGYEVIVTLFSEPNFKGVAQSFCTQGRFMQSDSSQPSGQKTIRNTEDNVLLNDDFWNNRAQSLIISPKLDPPYKCFEDLNNNYVDDRLDSANLGIPSGYIIVTKDDGEMTTYTTDSGELGIFDEHVGSVKVIGSISNVQVYENAQFTGASKTLSKAENRAAEDFNDLNPLTGKVSSIKINYAPVQIARPCLSGSDDDQDGISNDQDFNCMGKTCENNKVWTWSYILSSGETKQKSQTPAADRIGCCLSSQCTGGCGCVYKDSLCENKLCGTDNNWLQCDSSHSVGKVSESGKYYCTGSAWKECTNSNNNEVSSDGKYTCTNSQWARIANCLVGTADHDEDGIQNIRDIECMGKKCGSSQSSNSKTWVWSYVISQGEQISKNQATVPERIGCCGSQECRTIGGACISYDQPNDPANPKYMCDTWNNWALCDETHSKAKVSPTEKYFCDGQKWIACTSSNNGKKSSDGKYSCTTNKWKKDTCRSIKIGATVTLTSFHKKYVSVSTADRLGYTLVNNDGYIRDNAKFVIFNALNPGSNTREFLAPNSNIALRALVGSGDKYVQETDNGQYFKSTASLNARVLPDTARFVLISPINSEEICDGAQIALKHRSVTKDVYMSALPRDLGWLIDQQDFIADWEKFTITCLANCN